MAKRKSTVERAYERIHNMAVNFEFKPDERLNESALSIKLGISRTPLREALNRLVAEGLLTFSNGRGFFCRSLNPVQIQELYEARIAIESEALIRTIARASDAQLNALQAYLPAYMPSSDLAQMLQMDEAFHTRLAELSNNSELLHMLENINVRIRYVRSISLQHLRDNKGLDSKERRKLSTHRIIMEAAISRDPDRAVKALRTHIERHQDEITEAVRIAYSQLYVPKY